MSKIKPQPTPHDIALQRAIDAQRKLTKKVSRTLHHPISENAKVSRYKGGLMITEQLPSTAQYMRMKITYISRDGRIKTEIMAHTYNHMFTLQNGSFSAPTIFRSAVQMARRVISQGTSDTLKKY